MAGLTYAQFHRRKDVNEILDVRNKEIEKLEKEAKSDTQSTTEESVIYVSDKKIVDEWKRQIVDIYINNKSLLSILEKKGDFLLKDEDGKFIGINDNLTKKVLKSVLKENLFSNLKSLGKKEKDRLIESILKDTCQEGIFLSSQKALSKNHAEAIDKQAKKPDCKNETEQKQEQEELLFTIVPESALPPEVNLREKNHITSIYFTARNDGSINVNVLDQYFLDKDKDKDKEKKDSAAEIATVFNIKTKEKSETPSTFNVIADCTNLTILIKDKDFITTFDNRNFIEKIKDYFKAKFGMNESAFKINEDNRLEKTENHSLERFESHIGALSSALKS